MGWLDYELAARSVETTDPTTIKGCAFRLGGQLFDRWTGADEIPVAMNGVDP